MQTQVKRKGESWADFGEDLKTLTDKAYADIADEARECFALNQYLSQLRDPQVAFAVKQTKSTTVDDAIRATLEMESYSRPSSSGIAQVTEDTDEHKAVAATLVLGSGDMMLILERMERMETQLRGLQIPYSRVSTRGRGRRKAGRAGLRNCCNCGREGHLARECPSPKTVTVVQGNEKPPAL